MITIAAAAIYSTTEGEKAHELTYSEGSKVRVILQADGMMRKEGMVKGKWVLVGKPYIVIKSRPRIGERLIKQIEAFLAE